MKKFRDFYKEQTNEGFDTDVYVFNKSLGQVEQKLNDHSDPIEKVAFCQVHINTMMSIWARLKERIHEDV